MDCNPADFLQIIFISACLGQVSCKSSFYLRSVIQKNVEKIRQKETFFFQFCLLNNVILNSLTI